VSTTIDNPSLSSIKTSGTSCHVLDDVGISNQYHLIMACDHGNSAIIMLSNFPLDSALEREQKAPYLIAFVLEGTIYHAKELLKALDPKRGRFLPNFWPVSSENRFFYIVEVGFNRGLYVPKIHNDHVIQLPRFASTHSSTLSYTVASSEPTHWSHVC
jgi:hypothetical protein